MIDPSFAFTILTVIVGAGAVYITRRITGSTDGWRDVAEQRKELLADRERTIGDLREQVQKLNSRLHHLESEVAELKRHDLSAVVTLVTQVGTDLSRRLDDIQNHLAA